MFSAFLPDKDAERQHREVVSIYRTHLLSAAQVSSSEPNHTHLHPKNSADCVSFRVTWMRTSRPPCYRSSVWGRSLSVKPSKNWTKKELWAPIYRHLILRRTKEWLLSWLFSNLFVHAICAPWSIFKCKSCCYRLWTATFTGTNVCRQTRDIYFL